MHAKTNTRRLSLAAVLVAGVLASSWAGAVEEPANLGQVIYTTGTAAVQSGRDELISTAGAQSEPAQWRVASLDTVMLTTQVSTISIQSPGFVGVSPGRAATGILAVSQPVKAGEAASGQVAEPGFWSAALATLGLAVFFFLRRLS